MAKKLPPLKKVMRRMAIMVRLDFENKAAGTMGCLANFASHRKKQMIRTMPMMNGTRTWTLPHVY